MGFVYNPKSYDLTFADGDLVGLEVKVKGLSFGAYVNAMRVVKDLEKAETLYDEALATEELLPILATSIVSWNMEGILPTAEGLTILEPKALAEFATAWRDAIAGVSTPLSDESVMDIPMEVAS